MSLFERFVFEDYEFDETKKLLTLTYSFDSKLFFKEEFGFDFEFENYDVDALKAAIEALFFVAGVSYYKSYLPNNIIVKKGRITASQAAFYSKLYQKGLGEFFYTNQLDPNKAVQFPVNTTDLPLSSVDTTGFLVSIGGGKDSLVSYDLLSKHFKEKIETWSLNHEQQLKPLIETIGSHHNYVSRKIDEKLLQPQMLPPGKLSGHVPISAIFACTGVIVALLRGKQNVVMSNERSADEATLSYRGVRINHQYSKTSEFEKDFQNFISSSYGNSVQYFSLLRPLSEVQIAKYFAEHCFDKYQHVFSSCNRAFVHGETKLFWDGKCPKCAFIYLIFQPFLSEEMLDSLFRSNILADPDLDYTYQQLLGLTDEKPLECIGEINESRWAMRIAQQKYPHLQKYIFDDVADSEIFKLTQHNIPQTIAEKINYLANFLAD